MAPSSHRTTQIVDNADADRRNATVPPERLFQRNMLAAIMLIRFNSPAGSRCASLAGLEPLQLNSDFINHYRRMFAPSAATAMSAANKLMMPTAASVAAAAAAAVSSRIGQAAAMTTEDKGECV